MRRFCPAAALPALSRRPIRPLVRVRKRVRRRVSVRVLPKELSYVGGLPPFHHSENGQEDVRENNMAVDYGDPRPYRPGDGIKSIHWKLSTKLDELQVRKHISESDQTLLVFADPADGKLLREMSEPMAAEVENRVVEEALAAICHAAEHGVKGRLAWSDPKGTLSTLPFTDRASADGLSFSLSEVALRSGRFPRETVAEEELSVLCVTAFLPFEAETEERLLRLASDCGIVPCGMILLSLEEFLDPKEAEIYVSQLEKMRLRLAHMGIFVTVSRRKEGWL